jgi:hypothetical protein
MEPDISAIQPPTTDELERERIRRRLEEFASAPQSIAGGDGHKPGARRRKRRAIAILKPPLPR